MTRAAAFLMVLCFSERFLVAADGPETYGTTAVSYMRVPAVALVPITSAMTYSGTFGQRWGTSLQVVFYAPLQLPSGARVISLDFDLVDTDVEGSLIANLTECDRYGDNCVFIPAAGVGPADCVSPGFLCSGDAFAGGVATRSADLAPDGVVVDPVNQTLFVRCHTSFNGDQQRCAGFLVGYQLQVSPAPGVASFGDVPTNHPFFQYVEALVASGVTAGCGSGNYCPDNPVTRGQMAVFLSLALGLQFP